MPGTQPPSVTRGSGAAGRGVENQRLAVFGSPVILEGLSRLKGPFAQFAIGTTSCGTALATVDDLRNRDETVALSAEVLDDPRESRGGGISTSLCV